DLLTRSIGQRTAGADGGAHRLFTNRCTVITQIAFHHQRPLVLHLGNPKWTSQDTVIAGDAPRFAGGLDHAVSGLLDRVGRADLGAGRRVAVHADDRNGLGGVRALQGVELDHRDTFVRITFAAGVYAGLTANA